MTKKEIATVLNVLGGQVHRFLDQHYRDGPGTGFRNVVHAELTNLAASLRELELGLWIEKKEANRK